MAYSAAIFYLDLESGSDAARTALTSCTASNPSGSVTRINKTAHGLVTGAVVDLTLFSSWLNSAWKITVVDADNFDLDGATWQTTADNSGTATPRGGSSKADAWATFTSGATSARIAGGDTLRVKASADETLVGSCTWTNNSKTVTLPGAVTATISDCETAWTASANVTSTADTVQFKENTKSAKHVIAAGFTTGLVAYFATGTLNLSGYQQVTFWFYTTAAIAASTLSLRLCSDTAGATTVHTIAIPAIANTTAWTPITVDLGANLNSAIASVALYADLDPGAVTVQLDNILACKASSSADSLTLHSLIGKAHNLKWAASTAYSVGDIRKPTNPNRNGFAYRCSTAGTTGASEPTWPQELTKTVTDGTAVWTCYDYEETWLPIQSINGTTVKIDNVPSTLGSAGRGYAGATETVATYKREPLRQAYQSSSSSTTGYAMAAPFNLASPFAISGGWDRTSMAAQSGETWISGNNGTGAALNFNGCNNISLDNVHAVRMSTAFSTQNVSHIAFTNCHAVGCAAGFQLGGSGSGFAFKGKGLGAANCGSSPFSINSDARLTNFFCHSNIGTTPFGVTGGAGSAMALSLTGVSVKNNSGNQFISHGNGYPIAIRDLTTSGNAFSGAPIVANNGGITLNNCVFSEATPISVNTTTDAYVYSGKHNGNADAHYMMTSGGTIQAATDQRHTASGISWKFNPTSTNRNVLFPLKLSVAKIACAANVTVNVTIWTRRDNTNINGTLKLAGGQLAGADAEVTVACAPTINTWTQSGTLSFTPTEAGVVEITFECYDGVTTSSSFWVDDLAIS